MGKRLVCFFILTFVVLQYNAQCLSAQQLDTCRIYRSIAAIQGHEHEVYRVDLSKKKLKAIPQEVLQCPHLQELKMNKNDIREIPESIRNCKELQRIEMQFNRIDSLPPGLFSLSHLKKLDLGYNDVFTIPDAIGDLQELEILAMWDNPIGIYSHELLRLNNLKHLDLLNNPINESVQRALQEGLPNCQMHFSFPCQCEVGW
jgi:Leucine-rich repeat (LRR) protein